MEDLIEAAESSYDEEHKSEQPSFSRKRQRHAEPDLEISILGRKSVCSTVIPAHAARLLEAMSSFRRNDLLCDVVVKSANAEIHAHKLVLAACSEYFRAALANGMRESSMGIIDLNKVPGTGDPVDAAALEVLIDFAYSGVVAVTESNVLELLITANQLEMPEVLAQCCQFLLRRMDVQNCLGIMGLAGTYSLHSMRQQAEIFTHRHFEEVARSDEFLNLSLENLLQLLESDALSVSSEEVVAEAALRWLEFESATPNRRDSGTVAAVLKGLRLPLLSTSYIADRLQPHPAIIGSPDTMPLLLAAYQFHCRSVPLEGPHWPWDRGPGNPLQLSFSLPSEEESNLGMVVVARQGRPNAFQSLRAAALRPYLRKAAVQPVLYAIGGDDGHNDRQPYKCAMYLHAALGEWIQVAELNQSRSVCGVACCGQKIYAVGGYDGERALDTVEAFDPTTNSWQWIADMHQRRCSCVCAVLEDKLYVVGGVCGPMALKDVERYDPEEDIWVHCRPMSEGRSGCGVAGLGGHLFAVGGINGLGETVATAEVYNPRTQTWSPLQPMNYARRSFGLAALDGKLYACGGNDGIDDLSSLEEYNPQTNRWAVRASMSRARMYCSVGVLNGKLYAVGGLDGNEALQLVECYDPELDLWHECPPLQRSLCGCGVAVMDCPRQNY